MFKTYLHVTHMSSGNGPRETGTSEEWWGITSGRLCERVSDLDVFIVLSHSPKPVRDLFPYTREEVTARVPSLLLDAVTRSRWRYTRGRGSPPP